MTNLSFETAVEINTPIETVYRYVADLPRHTEWNHQPQALTKLTPGPAGVGTKYKTKEQPPSNMSVVEKVMMFITMPIMKRKFNFDGYTIAEIIDLTPNSRVAWTSHAPTKDGKKLMEVDWTIELEQRNGMTRVTQTGRPNPPADSPFASKVDVPKLKEEATANLQRLKLLLDGKATVPSIDTHTNRLATG